MTEISFEARLCWLTVNSLAHEIEDSELFDLLCFCTSTPNHTSEEERKSNVWIIQCGSGKKVKPAYFWVLRCRSDAAIFNSWPLSPGAGSWVTESDLPVWKFEKNSLESQWEICFHSSGCQVVSRQVTSSIKVTSKPLISFPLPPTDYSCC